jgi:hypothetical protein
MRTVNNSGDNVALSIENIYFLGVGPCLVGFDSKRGILSPMLSVSLDNMLIYVNDGLHDYRQTIRVITNTTTAANSAQPSAIHDFSEHSRLNDTVGNVSIYDASVILTQASQKRSKQAVVDLNTTIENVLDTRNDHRMIDEIGSFPVILTILDVYAPPYTLIDLPRVTSNLAGPGPIPAPAIVGIEGGNQNIRQEIL